MKPLRQTKGPQHVKTNQWRGETWTGIHWSLQGLMPVSISEKKVEKDLSGASKCQVPISSMFCSWNTKIYPTKMRPRCKTATKISSCSVGCYAETYQGGCFLFCQYHLHSAGLVAYQPICYQSVLRTGLSTSFLASVSVCGCVSLCDGVYE